MEDRAREDSARSEVVLCCLNKPSGAERSVATARRASVSPPTTHAGPVPSPVRTSHPRSRSRIATPRGPERKSSVFALRSYGRSASGTWPRWQRRGHKPGWRPRGSSGTLTNAGPCVAGWKAISACTLRTVRGETRIPSLSISSLAIRSSPHRKFSFAILRIRARSSPGIGGRPRRDFTGHSSFQPARRQRIKVAGLYDHQGAAPVEQL